jgi:hypothetical protein
VATAAQTDSGAACQPERLPLRVYHLKIAFNSDGTIVINGDFSSSHFFSEILPYPLLMQLDFNMTARTGCEYHAQGTVCP